MPEPQTLFCASADFGEAHPPGARAVPTPLGL